MKITEALTAEHKFICGLFTQIEALVPKVSTPSELNLLTRLMEDALLTHASGEEELLFSAFDQVLEHKNQRANLFREHQEIHTSLKTVKVAEKMPHARELLLIAIKVSREHFKREELGIFPQAEKFLTPETLDALGAAWFHHRASKP